MKRLAIALLALVVWACPGMLHASIRHTRHTAHPKVVRHHVARRPRVRHYTERAQRHRVVRTRYPRHYTRKARPHKKARRLRKAHRHKKVGHK
jgi:hypothetical protein